MSIDVSVIIPTFNRARYVVEAIDSVLKQTYRPSEILIIDDGSTDNTEEVIKGYRDHVRYVYQENRGVSAARNRGIMESSGDWVALLDSDDIWFPDKLKTQVEFVQKHPELIAHTVCMELPDGNSFDKCKFPCPDEYGVLKRPLSYQIQFCSLGMPPTILFKRHAAISAGLFDEELRIFEDYDFMCRLALEGPWGFTRRQLARYCRRDEDTEKLSDFRLRDEFAALEIRTRVLLGLWADDRLCAEEKRVLSMELKDCFKGLGMWNLRNGNNRESRFLARKSLSYKLSLEGTIVYIVSLLPVPISQWASNTWLNTKEKLHI